MFFFDLAARLGYALGMFICSLRHVLTFVLLLVGGALLHAKPALEVDGQSFGLTGEKSGRFTFAPEGEEAPSITMIFAEDGAMPLEQFTDGFREQFVQSGQLVKAYRASNTEGASIGFLVVGIMKTQDATLAKMVRTVDTAEGPVAIVYSRDFRGKDQKQDMVDWFQANGRRMEAGLLALKNLPTSESLSAAVGGD